LATFCCSIAQTDYWHKGLLQTQSCLWIAHCRIRTTDASFTWIILFVKVLANASFGFGCRLLWNSECHNTRTLSGSRFWTIGHVNGIIDAFGRNSITEVVNSGSNIVYCLLAVWLFVMIRNYT
jgi:hypothetical protein